ncbi:unnamed protein product [Effrenium voratum]|nr:unnamed protein product [Effrenium voratum]
MSLPDLRRLVQRASPRVEDVRSPDRTDIIRREHGHLPLREAVDALDALQFSTASFLRRFQELQQEPQEEGAAEEANAVASKTEQLKQYCAAQEAKPLVEMSEDTVVHQLQRLMSGLKLLGVQAPPQGVEPSLPKEWTDAPEEGWQQVASEEKAKGSEAFKQKNYQGAVEHYSKAIQVSADPDVALFSNRCAARLLLGLPSEALQDALRSVQLGPQWPKGFFRLGCCWRQLGHLEQALVAFATGQKLEPENKDWQKELEKTEKMQQAEPFQQVRQLLQHLLPDILAAWLRAASPTSVLQLQVNGSFQQLATCKWRHLQEGTTPPKAQIRYAVLDQKAYLANLAANLQSSSAEGFAICDLAGKALSIPDISKFTSEAGAVVHVDVKDDRDGKMKAIIASVPLEEGLKRFISKPKDPDPPKASVESVLTIQRRSGFPRTLPRYIGFQMFPGDLNFPVIDLLRDAPALADA